MTRRHLGTLAVLAALALGACSGGSTNSHAIKTATAGAITVGAYDPTRFDVSEIKATPGPLTVTFVNHGAIDHTFQIQGTSLLLRANPGRRSPGRSPSPRAPTRSSARSPATPPRA